MGSVVTKSLQSHNKQDKKTAALGLPFCVYDTCYVLLLLAAMIFATFSA